MDAANTHTHTGIHTRTRTRTHTHTHTRTHAHRSRHRYTHRDTHRYPRRYTHTCTYNYLLDFFYYRCHSIFLFPHPQCRLRVEKRGKSKIIRVHAWSERLVSMKRHSSAPLRRFIHMICTQYIYMYIYNIYIHISIPIYVYIYVYTDYVHVNKSNFSRSILVPNH